jgi:membrane protease YdiL (CAAX protease family)
MEDAAGPAARSPLVALGTVLAVTALVAGGMWLAFDPARAGDKTFWLFAGVPVALTPLALAWARGRGMLADWMRPRGGDFALGFVTAVFVFSAAYGVSRTLTPNGSDRAIWLVRLYLQLGDPAVLRAHSKGLFLGLIVLAGAEEIVWRGFVTSLLRDALGAAADWDWLAGAALYAVAALPTMWRLGGGGSLNPLLPLAALGAGAVWALMARRFGRLAPSIVSHALFDWAVVVLFRLWGESL